MQAVILAAGMGKRLRDLTKDNTKCMVKVNGVTLIERMLIHLTNLPITRVIIVIGFKGAELKAYLGNNFRGVPIEYIDNSEYAVTNNIYSLGLATDRMLQEDTLLLESDLIVEQAILEKLYYHPEKSLVAVAKYESWMDGSVVTIDEDNNILDLISKKSFNYKDCNDYYKTINIYKFSKEFAGSHFVPFLKAYINAVGTNEYYEQVLRVIAMLENPDIKAMPISRERWYEIDDIQDLDIASTLFAENEEKVKRLQSRFGGYWRFPELLDFCYLVNPYFPTKRMIEEMKSSFETLLTEYPSGMAVNRLLAAKYFEIKQPKILIGNGAAELINLLCDHEIRGRVGITVPTFEEYTNKLHNATPVLFRPQQSGFRYSAKEVIDFYTQHQVEWLVLINPDNPSGNLIPKEEMMHLCDWAEEHSVRLVLDESFIDFADNDESLFQDEYLDYHPQLIVIKSISKSYGVPGIRLGVVASGDIDLIERLRKRMAIWNINSYGEFFMQIIGKYEKEYRAGCQNFVNERSRFLEQLQQINFLQVLPSQANYFLCRVLAPFNSKQLTEKLLLDYNILIKDCSGKLGFENDNYIRIAIRDKKDNDELVKQLKALVPKVSC